MKNKFVFGVLLFCILAFCLIIFSCDSGSAGGSGGLYTVRYVISGPPIVADLVMWRNENGNYDQATNVQIPWEKTITLQGQYLVGACSATINNTSGSTYTAKIFVNEQEKYSANSTSYSVTVAGGIQ